MQCDFCGTVYVYDNPYDMPEDARRLHAEDDMETPWKCDRCPTPDGWAQDADGKWTAPAGAESPVSSPYSQDVAGQDRLPENSKTCFVCDNTGTLYACECLRCFCEHCLGYSPGPIADWKCFECSKEGMAAHVQRRNAAIKEEEERAMQAQLDDALQTLTALVTGHTGGPPAP
jgi:hypothetical protein